VAWSLTDLGLDRFDAERQQQAAPSRVSLPFPESVQAEDPHDPIVITALLPVAADAELEDWGRCPGDRSPKAPMDSSCGSMAQSRLNMAVHAGSVALGTDENEVIYVLSGRMTVTQKAENQPAIGAGDVRRVPARRDRIWASKPAGGHTRLLNHRVRPDLACRWDDDRVQPRPRRHITQFLSPSR